MAMRYLTKIVNEGDIHALVQAPTEQMQEEERQAFDIVRQHFTRYNQFPAPDTLMERGVRLPVADEPLDFYRDQVLNQIALTQAADLVTRLQEPINDRDGAQARQIINTHQTTVIDPHMRPLSYADMREQTLDNFTPNGTLGIARPTGLEAVDAQLGGVQSGDLWVLAGRPGVGKTWMQIAAVMGLVRQGERVLVWSNEMTVAQYRNRLAVLSTDMNPSMGSRNRASSFVRRIMDQRMDDALNGNDEHLLFVPNGSITTPREFGQMITETNATCGVVDGTYFCKATDESRGDSRNERFEKLIREFRVVGQDTMRHIGLTWQQNRNKSTGTEGLYGSDALSQDASLTVMLGKLKKHPEIITAHVAKNRHGPEGQDFGLSFEFRPTKIGELRDLPETKNRKNRQRGQQAHTDRAVQQALGGRRPAAEAPD